MVRPDKGTLDLGALAIAHSVAPNALTGSATFQVPIELPTGRHGFGPSLSLANSPTGTNFTLEMDDRIIPAMLRNQPAVAIDQALLLRHPADGVIAGPVAFQLNGQAITGFSTNPTFPG